MKLDPSVEIEVVRLLLLNVDILPDDVRIWCSEVLKKCETKSQEQEKKVTESA